ncbi:MAG: acyl carrier protein [Pseudomonadota bacterium]|nr:acyl carrier protein [Pseudomonadota bacterium]
MEQLSVGEDEVIPSANFTDDLGANETDKVVFIETFKEEFGVEIPDDAAKTILTVGDAIKFLEKGIRCLTSLKHARPGIKVA